MQLDVEVYHDDAQLCAYQLISVYANVQLTWNTLSRAVVAWCTRAIIVTIVACTIAAQFNCVYVYVYIWCVRVYVCACVYMYGEKQRKSVAN